MHCRSIYPPYLLHSRILLTAWDELYRCVIDVTVRQWRTRLRACVKAKGGHFEHRLSQLFKALLLHSLPDISAEVLSIFVCLFKGYTIKTKGVR